MPTIPVNDEGAVLYYEDSGAPEGSANYTTIIILHGFLFHGGMSSSIPASCLSEVIFVAFLRVVSPIISISFISQPALDRCEPEGVSRILAVKRP